MASNSAFTIFGRSRASRLGRLKTGCSEVVLIWCTMLWCTDGCWPACWVNGKFLANRRRWNQASVGMADLTARSQVASVRNTIAGSGPRWWGWRRLQLRTAKLSPGWKLNSTWMSWIRMVTLFVTLRLKSVAEWLPAHIFLGNHDRSNHVSTRKQVLLARSKMMSQLLLTGLFPLMYVAPFGSRSVGARRLAEARYFTELLAVPAYGCGWRATWIAGACDGHQLSRLSSARADRTHCCPAAVLGVCLRSGRVDRLYHRLRGL